jgi:predicted MPP superfamily phosphohydrolase
MKPNLAMRNVFLMHYPAWVENLRTEKYDLMLAGHSHGGQVRVPFYGALMVPFGVGRYDLGMFRTASGPLYVNPGIGWFPVPIRFNCRPEITVFEM